MILHFPRFKRTAQPFQARLSTFGFGLPFSDMFEFQVEHYTRRELARDADIAWVDQSYPGIRGDMVA